VLSALLAPMTSTLPTNHEEMHGKKNCKISERLIYIE
jgi:hypothetical protein